VDPAVAHMHPPRLWLTHHAEHQHDRCATVGDRLVCRRCLVTYPIALATAILTLVGVQWSPSLDPTLLWLLPAPAIADFVSEHALQTRYNPARQQVLSAIAAVAFGRGLGRYLTDPGDSLFWSVAITYSLVMAGSAIGRLIVDRRRSARAAESASLDWWNDLQQHLDEGEARSWADAAPFAGDPGEVRPMGSDPTRAG
jgi:hypothetical protein